ncbi:MAG: hypothetical protein BWZ02_03294 [Lentisphaerae bacterium ADurb.BinA184]|nr:MAG: hypothetical protein BWZ02_03294 [Lentisphaerae bacterium ADurb.BinA184]
MPTPPSPGASTPLTVTALVPVGARVPVPPSVAPAATVTGPIPVPEPVGLLTRSVPACTVMPPLMVLAPCSSRMPAPVLFSRPFAALASTPARMARSPSLSGLSITRISRVTVPPMLRSFWKVTVSLAVSDPNIRTSLVMVPSHEVGKLGMLTVRGPLTAAKPPPPELFQVTCPAPVPRARVNELGAPRPSISTTPPASRMLKFFSEFELSASASPSARLRTAPSKYGVLPCAVARPICQVNWAEVSPVFAKSV